MGETETTASVVVWAPALTVCRYLADGANIARCLPAVRSVRAAEEQSLTLGYDDAAARTARIAPGRFRLDHQGQRVDWEIRGAAFYSGTIGIYGDSNISQLQSVLRTDQPALSGAAHDLHVQMLLHIARAVEEGLDPLPATVAAAATPAAARLSVVSALPELGNLPGSGGPVPDKQGVRRGR